MPVNAPGAPASRVAISVQHVCKRYVPISMLAWRMMDPARHHLALDDVSFEVDEGETVGLLGPNGAGKTTTLKTIATLIYPSSGRVLAYGRDIHEDSMATRGMMGLVTCDERSFYWRLSGLHNLQFFATLYGLDKTRAAARIDELLEMLGLREAAGRPYHTYSSGMKQKLAIARGVLGEPKIVLYDEPTRSLDPVSAQGIRDWIRRAQHEHPSQTHVIATNRLDEAQDLCSRVIMLNHGRVVADGAIADLRARWAGEDLAVHRVRYAGPDLRAHAALTELESLLSLEIEPLGGGEWTMTARTRDSSDALSALLAVLLGAGGRILSVHADVTTFDEVFRRVVHDEQTRRRREETPS